MRTISTGLQDKQELVEGSRVPYIHLDFIPNSGIGAHIDYSSRWLVVDQWETTYGVANGCTLTLTNHDRAVADLRGYYCDIGWGDIVNGTPEYAVLQRFWVVSQTWVTSPNGLVSTVTLEDAMQHIFKNTEWDSTGSPPGFRAIWDRTYSPYALLNLILITAFVVVPGGFTLVAPDVYDDIIDTFLPYFIINDGTWNPSKPNTMGAYEKYYDIIVKLISMTRSYLRPQADLKYKVIYPQIDDSVDLTYYSDKKPQFYEYQEKLNVLTPDKVTVFYNATLDAKGYVLDWDNIESATSGDGNIVAYYMFPRIDDAGDAGNQAAAILTHLKSAIMSATIVVPHDCRIELYDRLAIKDARA